LYCRMGRGVRRDCRDVWVGTVWWRRRRKGLKEWRVGEEVLPREALRVVTKLVKGSD